MHLRDELHIGKSLDSGHEVALALLLTREYVNRLFEEQVFKPSGLSDQQYNLLRILKGGPEEGYLIKELRCRMIYRFADVPRLVARLVALGLVEKTPCPRDRRGARVKVTVSGLELERALRNQHSALCSHLDRCLEASERVSLLAMLERLRNDYRQQLEPSAAVTRKARVPRAKKPLASKARTGRRP